MLIWHLTVVEWEFVQGLAYREQTQEDADFVQLIYTSQLRKYKHAEEHTLTRRRLVQEFGLSDNPDVLFSFADALYAQFRWADCFSITTRSDCFLNPSQMSQIVVQDIGAGCYSQFYYAIAHCLHVPSQSPALETFYPST